MTYHLVRVVNTLAEPHADTFFSEEDLVTALKDFYAAAVKDPLKYVRARAYVFSGERITLTGRPRKIKFPDGRTVSLADEPESDFQDDGAMIIIDGN